VTGRIERYQWLSLKSTLENDTLLGKAKPRLFRAQQQHERRRGQLWLSALEQAIAAARRSPAMPPQKCCDCEKMLRLRKKIRLIV
jgi:hypothetical protein